MHTNEICDMHKFLGIAQKPSTIYKRAEQGCSYEVWLVAYTIYLRNQCEQKLVKEYNANLGKNLFQKQFSHFQEFDKLWEQT